MASRPVFVPIGRPPYVRVVSVEFAWNGGLAVSQKQKNITAIHAAFERKNPGQRLLEISSKSLQAEGVPLSAFNLMKFVPSLAKSVPVECVYHGGKVFEHAGPFTDLYTVPPKTAKGDERLRSGGALCGFFFEGESIPSRPVTAFYNWLYITALTENPELSKHLLSYDGFTDIEFSPDKSINCQACAAAVFVSLHRLSLLDKCDSFEAFRSIVTAK